jgi:hypothetical protein
MTQQTFKEPILKILRVWSEWCVFSQDQLRSYYDIFLDTTRPPPKANLPTKSLSRPSSFDDEIDGVPMSEAEYEAIMNESSSEEEEDERRRNDDDRRRNDDDDDRRRNDDDDDRRKNDDDVEVEQSFSLAQYGDIDIK